jgi:hypothetical protein
VVEGERADDRLFVIACTMRDLGVSKDRAAALIPEHLTISPWRDGETDDWVAFKIENAYRYGENEPGSKASPPMSVFAEQAAALPPETDTDVPCDDFHAWTIDELAALPPVEWLIPGVLMREGFAVIFGPTSKGKTFTVLAQTLPLTFEGHDIAYITGSGESSKRSIGERAAAWGQYHGAEASGAVRKHFRVFDQMPFNDSDMARRFCSRLTEQGLNPSVVVVDAFSSATGDLDENSSKDVQKFYTIAGVIEAHFNCLTYLVHHTGKNLALGERGSVRIRGGVNTSFELKHVEGDDFVSIHNPKQREGERLKEPLYFKWETVNGTLVYIPADAKECRGEGAFAAVRKSFLEGLKLCVADGVMTPTFSEIADKIIPVPFAKPDDFEAYDAERKRSIASMTEKFRFYVRESKKGAGDWGPLRPYVVCDIHGAPEGTYRGDGRRFFDQDDEG